MRTKSGNGHKVDLEQLLDDLKVVVRDGEELLKAGVTTVKEGALARARSADALVRDNPYRTVGIVFGVGIILGLVAVGFLRREPSVNLEDDD
jgi:ElaB/YqjD/DUF883 family membrane-anchored ribosome-binding protein